MENGQTKKQRIVINIDEVEHTGIATTTKVPNGLDVEVKGLVDKAGAKHENLYWHVQIMRPGRWLNFEIISLEDIKEDVLEETGK